jgi:hypothetical protein
VSGRIETYVVVDCPRHEHPTRPLECRLCDYYSRIVLSPDMSHLIAIECKYDSKEQPK